MWKYSHYLSISHTQKNMYVYLDMFVYIEINMYACPCGKESEFVPLILSCKRNNTLQHKSSFKYSIIHSFIQSLTLSLTQFHSLSLTLLSLSFSLSLTSILRTHIHIYFLTSLQMTPFHFLISINFRYIQRLIKSETIILKLTCIYIISSD